MKLIDYMFMQKKYVLCLNYFNNLQCMYGISMRVMFSCLLLNIWIIPKAHAYWGNNLWQSTHQQIKTIYTEGNNQLWVSGWAYHGRSTYTPEKLNQLNERAIGLGWGKTLRNTNTHKGIFGLMLLDSHKNWQYQMGYTYEKAVYFNKQNNNWYIAGGIAPALVRRQDMFNKIPFPAVFPLLSIGNKKAELRMTYLPRLSNHLGNGDVLYIFTSFMF